MEIKRREDLILRQVGDFYFLVDPKLSYNSDSEDLFQTNEIGAFIWNSLATCSTPDALCKKLLSALNDEITPELEDQVYNDIHEFLLELKENGFVTEE